MNKIRFLVALIVLHGPNVWSYEEPTHEAMSQAAAGLSVISTSTLLEDVGIDPLGTYPNGKGQNRTIMQLIRNGARFEDEVPRPVHHFFDPITESGLSQTAAGYVSVASPTWALEDRFFISFAQHYSYDDALDYYYDALALPTADGRRTKIGMLFRAIGQIGHHIQDMAQPQHARDDAHYYANPATYSRYEKYVSSVNLAGNLDFTGYAPVGGSSERGLFATPRDFWHTESMLPLTGRGIAEFTQSNFVSAGTNFDAQGHSGSRFVSPSFADAYQYAVNANALLESAGKPVPAVCEAPNPPCQMVFLATQVNDLYRSGQSAENGLTSTFSIFDQDLAPQNAEIFALNTFNFEAAHGFLIKRAVGYTAGLYNFFFRGQLEIEPPSEGIYAVVDHLTPSGNAKDTGGFDRVRVNVRNVTPGPGAPALESIPAGGQLRLIVRFHRNTCYTATLSGEFGALDANDQPFVANPDACRSIGEERLVSDAKPAGNAINSSTGQDITFQFSQRIPINATDIFIQIVYRGALGQDGDAIAVSVWKDISEPTYVWSLPERHDHFLRAQYPSFESGPYTWEEWCGQGGMTLEECNDEYGRRRMWRFSPVENYDPNVSPSTAGNTYPIAQEPAFYPVADTPSAVGKYGRIAMLVDLERPADSTPALIVGPYFLYIRLTEDGISAPEHYFWEWGGRRVNVIQAYPGTEFFQPPVIQYKQARGVFLERGQDTFYSQGTAPAVPPFQPVATEIAFPD